MPNAWPDVDAVADDAVVVDRAGRVENGSAAHRAEIALDLEQADP
jgi:hypothetical protein